MTREQHTLVEMDLGDIRRALRNSTEFFLEFALADEIAEDKTIPDFHILVFRRFIDFEQRRDVAALPREHAKTTLARLAFVYLTYFSETTFFVYVSSAHHIAVPSVESIWNRLTSDQFVEVFGYPEVVKERLAEGYIEFFVQAYRGDFFQL